VEPSHEELLCPGCGNPVKSEHEFCRTCGTSLHHAGLPDVEQAIALKLPEEKSLAQRAFSLVLKAIVVLFILFIITLALFYRSWQEAKKEARMKACQANMRILEGAIDMWEMDNDDQSIGPGYMIRDSDGTPGPIADKIIGYIKRLPECREGGAYYYVPGKHWVRCSAHGTVDNPLIPDGSPVDD